MSRTHLLLCLATLLSGMASVSAAVWIHVPADFSTIQAAIDAAPESAVICVGPGTYTENLDFKGNNVVLTAVEGPETTVIDGGTIAPVIFCGNGETRDCMIHGFTLTHGFGNAQDHTAGAISCKNGASPVIIGCRIVDNYTGCGGGGIIASDGSTALITRNTIAGNTAESRGGGIFCINSRPEISDNVITGNEGASSGGAIFGWMGAAPVIQNNLLTLNTAETGGGIGCINSTMTIRNNTIWGNSMRSDGGAGIHVTAESTVLAEDNIIVANGGGTGLYVGDDASVMTADYNDYYLNSEGTYSGFADPGDHDLLEDPCFAGSEEEFFLAHTACGDGMTSPCVDSGSMTAEAAGLDWAHTRRDGVPDSGVVDMGYHHLPNGDPVMTVGITLNQAAYQPGDRFLLTASVENPGPAELVRQFVFLEIDGRYWFWPSWGEALDCSVLLAPRNSTNERAILDFTWPEGVGPLPPLRFWHGLLGMHRDNLAGYDVTDLE